MENKNALQTKVKTYSIDRPAEMVKVAAIIRDYIVKNNLSVKIVNKDYIMVEGWQFAGGMLGLLPRIVKVEKLDDMKWLAQAEIVNTKTEKVIGTGYALCSKAESKKATFDEYAILSMSQTRAIGKAYRNLIGWVVKMAGYEAAPAEEMTKIGQQLITETTKVSEKISQEESDKILSAAIASGFKTKAQAITGINRLLKINIKELSELTQSQAKTIQVALLQKKQKND